MLNHVIFLYKKKFPCGVAAWEEKIKFLDLCFIDNENIISDFSKEDIANIEKAKEKILNWISKEKLPRHHVKIVPYSDEWWMAVKSLLIHNTTCTYPVPSFEESIEGAAEKILETLISITKGETYE